MIRTASPGSQAAEVAACTLWNMIMGSVAMQQVFRELGGVGVLVGVLVRHQEDLGLAVISAGMLGDLADGSRGAREVIREEGAGGMGKGVFVGQSWQGHHPGTAQAVFRHQRSLGAMGRELAEAPAQEVERRLMSPPACPGGVAALVELLRHEPGEQAAEACCSALANLAVFSPPNQEAIRMQGGVQAVVSVLQTCNDLSSSVAEEASRALGNLARSEANRNLILESNGIRALVGVLWAGPGTSSAHEALVALGNLAYDSLENQKAIAAAGGVWAVLSLMAAAPPGCETIEPAACVLACLMACQAAVDKLCQESHAPVLASILRSHHGSSSVIGEALLNIVATAAILPAMSAPLVKAGIFCDLVLVLGCCADMLESAAPQQELVAIAVEGLVSGSPENRIAARDQGIIPPLVHLVSSAAPSLSSTSDFASSLISKVECKVGRSGPEKGSCQKLVMELLVQLMETGTNAMVHQAAADALKLFEEPCKDRGSLPDTAKATQSAGDQKLLTARDSMVEVSVFPSGCVAGRPPPHPRTHLTKHSGLSGLNVSEWALPVAHETWDEEDDTSSATVKGVGIDPLKSEQVQQPRKAASHMHPKPSNRAFAIASELSLGPEWVAPPSEVVNPLHAPPLQIDALYSQTFAAAILPPGCCVAAVRALASLASGDEESQVTLSPAPLCVGTTCLSGESCAPPGPRCLRLQLPSAAERLSAAQRTSPASQRCCLLAAGDDQSRRSAKTAEARDVQ